MTGHYSKKKGRWITSIERRKRGGSGSTTPHGSVEKTTSYEVDGGNMHTKSVGKARGRWVTMPRHAIRFTEPR